MEEEQCSAVLNGGGKCGSGGRFRRCWSGGLKALWAAVGRSGWLKNNESRRHRGIWYPVFGFSRIVETVRILYLLFL